MTFLADKVEQLTMEYSSRIELSFDCRARTRNLRCSFCNRPFKYQMVLDEHVTTKHMTDLKTLTDDERRDFLQKYIKVAFNHKHPIILIFASLEKSRRLNVM